MRTTHLPNLLACLIAPLLFFFLYFIHFLLLFLLSLLFLPAHLPIHLLTYPPAYLPTYFPSCMSMQRNIYLFTPSQGSGRRRRGGRGGGRGGRRGGGGGGMHTLPGGPITKTTLNATCDLPPPGLFATFHVHLLPPFPPSLTPHSSSHAPCPRPRLAPARSKYTSQGGRRRRGVNLIETPGAPHER